MPLTEVVILLSCLIAWSIATGLWAAHCLQVERSVFAGAPAWKRLAHRPALALAGGLPVAGYLSLALLRRMPLTF